VERGGPGWREGASQLFMDPHSQWILVGAFVVGAVAIVIQVVLMYATYRTSRATKDQISSLIARVEPVIGTAQRLLEETRTHVAEISTQVSELLASSRKQVPRVDEVLAEATTRARAQMDRIEMVLDDTVDRFQETTTLLQNSIMKPLKQVAALTIGIRAALSYLLGGRRTTVEQATHDEEMFI
jgi:ABC-type transporter Mla subunit MlaD